MLQLLLISLLASFLGHATELDQSVNQLISMTHYSDEDLAGTKGIWKCEYEIPYPHQFQASDDKIDFAILKTQVLCIKYKCQNINKMLNEAYSNLQTLSDEDLDAYLEGQNYSAELRKDILSKRKNIKDLPQTDCETGPQNLKNTIVHLCLNVSISCSKESRELN
ncbi:MAG: hypothetical protein AB7I27_09295 [Bacteriovoracaceae bacterium]